jgi:hypothetical protein
MQQPLSRIITRRLACAAFVAALAAVTLSHTALAGAHNNVLTFRQTVALPGKVLPAGSYIFELATTATSHDVVRVRDRRTGQAMFAGFTVKVDRPNRRGREGKVTLGEAPAGAPVPVLVWYPDGVSYGHQFIYR